MKSRLLYILLSGLALGLFGCSDETEIPENAVMIGALYPFSGAQAEVGREIRQGIQLAVDIINNPYDDLNLPLAQGSGLSGLGGLPVQVIYVDHKSTVAGARDGARRLVTDDKVVAVLGSYQSEETRAATEVTEQAGIPFLNPDSTSPGLTERNFQWFFRTTPTDTTFVTDSFEFISELNSEQSANIQRVAVVHESSDFGTGVMNIVNEFAPQYQIQVVADVVTQGTTDTIPAGVTQIRAAQPDAVLFAVYSTDAIGYMQEFKRQNYAPPLIWADDAGFSTQEFQESLGTDAEYVTSREVWSLDVTQFKPIAAQVNALYRARYGVDMNGNSVRGFIGMMTLAEAINRAASTDPVLIRDALRTTDIPADQLIAPWRGIRFDQTGQNTLGDGLIVQMLDGRYTSVWPRPLALQQTVFPFPQWNSR